MIIFGDLDLIVNGRKLNIPTLSNVKMDTGYVDVINKKLNVKVR